MEDPALETARKLAIKEGVPEERLRHAKGIMDVQDIRRQWMNEQKDQALEQRRKAAGLPSLRDAKAHGRLPGPAPTPKCDRCGGPGEDPHPCPFAEEIHEDSETQCNCCESCTEECAMDI